MSEEKISLAEWLEKYESEIRQRLMRPNAPIDEVSDEDIRSKLYALKAFRQKLIEATSDVEFKIDAQIGIWKGAMEDYDEEDSAVTAYQGKIDGLNEAREYFRKHFVGVKQ